jgi:hypothetical protein
MATAHSILMLLTDRYREQARSHIAAWNKVYSKAVCAQAAFLSVVLRPSLTSQPVRDQIS